MRQIQFADLQQRLALAFGGDAVREILLIGRDGILEAAQPLKQAGLERGALGAPVVRDDAGGQRHEIGRARQRRLRPPVGNLDAAEQVLP